MRTILLVLMSVLLGAAAGAAAATFWQRQHQSPSVRPPVAALPLSPSRSASSGKNQSQGFSAAQWAALDERLSAIETNIVKLDERSLLTTKELDEMNMRIEVRTGQLRPFREPSQREPLVPMKSTAGQMLPLPAPGASGTPAKPPPAADGEEMLPDWK